MLHKVCPFYGELTCSVSLTSNEGRHVMTSDPETVEVPEATVLPDFDKSEVAVYTNFTYLVNLLKSIRKMNDVFTRLKVSNNWAGDPEFLACGPTFDRWAYELP